MSDVADLGGGSGGRRQPDQGCAPRKSFMKDVIEESKTQPVLVDFWAPWCGPCKQLTPVLEKAVKAAKGKVKLVKMDIDKHPEDSGPDGHPVDPAPSSRLSNGQPVDGFMGALPEKRRSSRLSSALTKGKIGDEGADQLKAADDALAAGDAAEARRYLRADPGAGRRATSRRLPVWRAATSRTGNLEQASEDARHDPGSQAERRRGRRRAAPRWRSPSRPNRSARSTNCSRRSPPIRSTIRRASISRPR